MKSVGEHVDWLPALLNPAAIAAIASAITAVVLKLADTLTSHHAADVDEATALRQEMRIEIERLRADVQRQDAELDEWRGKYYVLLEEAGRLRGEVAMLRAELARLGRQVNGCGPGGTGVPSPEGA
jgi:hypothetical protein